MTDYAAEQNKPIVSEAGWKARAADAEAALRELVALKDGPRDADYERRKPLAWQAARDLLTIVDIIDQKSDIWPQDPADPELAYLRELAEQGPAVPLPDLTDMHISRDDYLDED